MEKGVFFLLLSILCGCSSFDASVDSRIVGDALALPDRDYRVDFRRGRFLISGSKVGINDIVRSLASYGVRVACGEGLDRSVSIDIDGDYSMLEVMRMIEVKFNCRASKSGDVWILDSNMVNEKSSTALNGSSSSGSVSEGGYVYVFRVWGFSEDEVLQRLGGYGVLKLGNAVYYSRLDLRRVMELDALVMEMLVCVPVQYFFTVWFVSEDVLRDVGLDTSFSVSGVLGKVFSRGSSIPYDYRMALDVVSNSNFDLSNKKGVRRMGGVVREGSEFSFRLGDDIPFAKRSVSDNGTVSDTGYEYQHFGFSVKVKIEGRSFGLATLDIENTDIGGYVSSYPIKHGSTLNTVLQIGDGSRVYVGSCLMDSDSRGFLTFRRQVQYYHVLLQCDVVEVGRRVESLLDFEK